MRNICYTRNQEAPGVKRYNMNIYSIFPLITSLAALTVGVFVFLQNTRARANITFFLSCVVTFWWQFSWVILFNTKDPVAAAYLVKVGYSGVIFIPITFFHFIAAFLGLEKQEKLFIKVQYAIGTALLYFCGRRNCLLTVFISIFGVFILRPALCFRSIWPRSFF